MLGRKKRTNTLRRALALALLLVFTFTVLALRVLSLQVLDFARYQKKVFDQLTTESRVSASRGKILDSAGRVLATERTVYQVCLYPSLVARADDAAALKEKMMAGLPPLLSGVDSAAIATHLSHTRELSRTVAKRLDEATARAVLAFIREEGLADYLSVEAVSDRYYPYGSLAAQVIGFTGSDGQGLYGLELQYDTLLAGKAGAYITARDAAGNRLPNRYESLIPAVDGATVETTLDAYIQAVLEEQLEATMIESGAENRVCGIVMNVKTGAVLAMATTPTFDLNDPFTLNEYAAAELAAMGLAEGSDEYKAAKTALLLESWSNKAATEIYMPGSTFKAITCSAVLEEGAVTNLNEGFFCSGALNVADRCIHCHKKGGHGSLTFTEGLQNSCNPVMMTIAARIGTDCFYNYVRDFGLLEKTGVDLPGEGNSIFHAPSNFTGLDLATASFGQNFKVSVLQMITAISAIANDGKLLSPYLVERVTAESGEVLYQHETTVKRQVVSEKTADTICEILAGGVAGEGGAKNAYVAGYRVAAKTGTSEKIGDDRTARIGSCVGFAPADDPEIAVIIVVDEPTDGSRYGSVVAAPYVASVFEAALPYLGVEAVYTADEAALATVTVPDLIGMPTAEANKILGLAGFTVNLQGEGAVVTAQSPTAGSTLQKSSATITLGTGEEAPLLRAVPSLVGMTASAANKLLTDMGFNIRLSGAKDYAKTDKTVVGQSPAAGTMLPVAGVVTVQFPYDEAKD
ncbi:MAG: PASTA domain-containing protein [Clostridia bacterium]|nr:PASTA domain-containing protein [Clostridia bacterium]